MPQKQNFVVFFWPNFATISWANNLKHVWCLLQNELKMCTKTNSNESSNSCFSLKDKLKEKNEICSTHWQFFLCFKHVSFISPSWVCLLKKNNESYYSCFSPNDKLGEKRKHWQFFPCSACLPSLSPQSFEPPSSKEKVKHNHPAATIEILKPNYC